MFMSFCVYLIVKVCAVFPSRGSGARYGLTHFSRRPVAVLPHVAISHSSMASPVLCLLFLHMNTLALRCKSLWELQGQRWESLHSLGMTNICVSHQNSRWASRSLSKLSASITPTAARTAVCLTPPKTSIQASMRDKSKREIHHCRKSGLIKALHGSSKYNQCLGRKVLLTATLHMSRESRDCSLS